MIASVYAQKQGVGEPGYELRSGWLTAMDDGHCCDSCKDWQDLEVSAELEGPAALTHIISSLHRINIVPDICTQHTPELEA